MRDFFAKFVKTEITSPFNINDTYEYTNLERIQKRIDEDLWIQIAEQKQKEPQLSDPSSCLRNLRKKLVVDWECIFEAFGLKSNPKIFHEINTYAKKSLDNTLRIAQSLARDKGLKEVSSNTLNDAYKLFTKNSEDLTENTGLINSIKIKVTEMREDAKLNAVRAELSTNIFTIIQLHENVKRFFEDILGLQKYIEDLIIEDPKEIKVAKLALLS